MALLERGVRGVEAVALVHKASIGGEELALFRALVLEALEQRSGPAFSVGLACALDGVLEVVALVTERFYLFMEACKFVLQLIAVGARLVSDAGTPARGFKRQYSSLFRLQRFVFPARHAVPIETALTRSAQHCLHALLLPSFGHGASSVVIFALCTDQRLVA
jgi:hypothetical protein